MDGGKLSIPVFILENISHFASLMSTQVPSLYMVIVNFSISENISADSLSCWDVYITVKLEMFVHNLICEFCG